MRTQPRTYIVLGALLWSAGLASAARPPSNLGSLLDPSVNSTAVSINDRGQVVGMAIDPRTYRGYPVVWEKNSEEFEAHPLGSLDGPTWYELDLSGYAAGPQRAINQNSQIVGRSWGESWGAVIWQQPHGAFVRSYLPGGSSAKAINNLEQIVGYGDYWEAPGSSPSHLPVPPGYSYPLAYDINDRGQVVGTVMDAQYRDVAVLWNPNGGGGFDDPIMLPNRPERGYLALAINNYGKAVGFSLQSGGSHACVWSKQGDQYEVDELALPAGYVNASANGINDAGQVAGFAINDKHWVAVLWRPDSSGALRPTVLPSGGFSGTRAATVNNRGQVVGMGSRYDPDLGDFRYQALLWDMDTTPPTISGVSANPAVLWPPNHKMANVTVEYTATDDSGSVDCGLGEVTSNEPLSSQDWTILDHHHVQLLSERAGVGTGRKYSVPITCVDPSGNAATRPVTVTVPHDQRR